MHLNIKIQIISAGTINDFWIYQPKNRIHEVYDINQAKDLIGIQPFLCTSFVRQRSSPGTQLTYFGFNPADFNRVGLMVVLPKLTAHLL
jgi:hypothetical protein